MSISNSCMVVNLQIGLWKGYRLDKEASRTVTEQNGAHADAARVNKHLIPKEALAPIESAAGAVRTHFYANTLPWKDNGDRVLTRKRYAPFIQAHEELRTRFDNAVEDFLARSYAEARAKAEFRMGELFKAEDYPEARSLRPRFYVNMDIDAVTTAGDFRVALDENAAEIVRNGMESAMETRLRRAMTDVWARLADVVTHFHDKMADTDAVFRDSTVEKLAEVVELLPDLNVLDDPDLERIRVDVAERLVGLTAKDLRKDPVVRSTAADEAKRIIEDMKGFMNAFGGGEA